MNYTSRSAIECADECERKRWFNYFYLGTGIVPAGDYIPLLIGSAVHLGIELTAKGSGDAIPTATRWLVDRVDKGVLYQHTEEQTDYAVLESTALVEALLRSWVLREYPRLRERFDVVAVEKEHSILLVGREYRIPLTKDIVLLSKPDQVLQDKQTGDIYNYSIKTTQRWYQRMEDAYYVDLQGVTEALAVTVVNRMRVLGTKFCFLIKGERRLHNDVQVSGGEVRERELWITDSPLIYGYVNDQDGHKQYAYTTWVRKSENKSGWGRISHVNAWKRFPVWETKEGVAKWIEYLACNKIQPELGEDIIKTHVVTPVEVHRTDPQLMATLVQLRVKEERMFTGRDAVENGDSIDKWFPMNRRSCYFPSSCEYLPICPVGSRHYNAATADNPLKSGEYIRRVPHYETEKQALSARVADGGSSTVDDFDRWVDR